MALKDVLKFKPTDTVDIDLIPVGPPDTAFPYGGVAFICPVGCGMGQYEGQEVLMSPSTRQEAIDAAIALRIVSRQFNRMARKLDIRPEDDISRPRHDREAWKAVR